MLMSSPFSRLKWRRNTRLALDFIGLSVVEAHFPRPI